MEVWHNGTASDYESEDWGLNPYTSANFKKRRTK